jgi:hypothetical protein
MMDATRQELEDRVLELEEENALLLSRLEDAGVRW